jgi:hypothetical protein
MTQPPTPRCPACGGSYPLLCPDDFHSGSPEEGGELSPPIGPKTREALRTGKTFGELAADPPVQGEGRFIRECCVAISKGDDPHAIAPLILNLLTQAQAEHKEIAESLQAESDENFKRAETAEAKQEELREALREATPQSLAWCCPFCEEVVCDEGCPFARLRAALVEQAKLFHQPPTPQPERCDGSGRVWVGRNAFYQPCPGCPDCSPQESSAKESDAEEASQ